MNDLGVFYGITDIIFLEYLRTLGVRTWDNDGTNKLAYETILCELSNRGWCSVNCGITGIDEQIKTDFVSVYPNPTSGLINIDTKKSVKQIKIYNSLGKLSLSTKNTVININEFSNGIYYLSVQFETGEIEREKLMKN